VARLVRGTGEVSGWFASRSVAVGALATAVTLGGAYAAAGAAFYGARHGYAADVVAGPQADLARHGTAGYQPDAVGCWRSPVTSLTATHRPCAAEVSMTNSTHSRRSAAGRAVFGPER
jgi:hypothetical protein